MISDTVLCGSDWAVAFVENDKTSRLNTANNIRLNLGIGNLVKGEGEWNLWNQKAEIYNWIL